jgi:16S rRNA (guanine527-N7)-methyltransferase
MQILKKYFPDLSSRQLEQFYGLNPLYHYWNQRINVISRKDIDNLAVNHVLHSLSIARFIVFKPGTVILDAGTGGGFPGIPLAILFPEVKFVLVDSIAKKIRVVEAIIGASGLSNCQTRNLRLEALQDQADFVICRAVAEIPRLFGWVRKNIIPGGSHSLKNGLLALKGGALDEELKTMGPGVQVFDLKSCFDELFFETKKLVHVSR